PRTEPAGAVTERRDQPSRPNQVAAGVGIIAGVVFIAAAIFFAGFFTGTDGNFGGHRGYYGGHMGPAATPGTCPMMGHGGQMPSGPMGPGGMMGPHGPGQQPTTTTAPNPPGP
ncbi:MAG: hypothetical protein ACPGVG_19245, partial [Mycobacterium sp.]